MGLKGDVAELTGLVYEAAVDVKAWPAAIARIADAIRAHATSIEIYDTLGGKPPVVAAPRTDPGWLRIFRERWSANNIVRERSLAQMPVGRPFNCDQLIPRSNLERTAYYNEFWAPQRINKALFVNLLNDGRAVSGAGFYRSSNDGDFDGEEVGLLGAIVPHLQRAVSLNLRLARLEMDRHSSVEMLNQCGLGALLVDKNGQILFANTAAEAILREADGLRVRDGRLTGATADALRSSIAGNTKAPNAGILALPCSDGRKVAIQILPIAAETAWLSQRPAAIVFIKDPKLSVLPSADDIRILFDLTPAQSALTREILRGDGIQAAADRLGISRTTARTHLAEIFQRTGTNRQAELVRVILQQCLGPSARVGPRATPND